jgi:signal transduction histidine kinase
MIETACFRIVQEALTNITRHAQRQARDIDLFREGDDWCWGCRMTAGL